MHSSELPGERIRGGLHDSIQVDESNQSFGVAIDGQRSWNQAPALYEMAMESFERVVDRFSVSRMLNRATPLIRWKPRIRKVVFNSWIRHLLQFCSSPFHFPTQPSARRSLSSQHSPCLPIPSQLSFRVVRPYSYHLLSVHYCSRLFPLLAPLGPVRQEQFGYRNRSVHTLFCSC